jgi:hypothetical protein
MACKELHRHVLGSAAAVVAATAVPDQAPRMKLEIVPGIGVPPVLLGMAKTDLKAVLGAAEDDNPRVWTYCDAALRVTFDESERVAWIELSIQNAPFDVFYSGIDVAATSAAGLVQLITGEEPSDSDRDAFEYHHDGLDLALWRPVVPSMYEESDPDDEYQNGTVWQTFGVGNGRSRP